MPVKQDNISKRTRSNQGNAHRKTYSKYGVVSKKAVMKQPLLPIKTEALVSNKVDIKQPPTVLIKKEPKARKTYSKRDEITGRTCPVCDKVMKRRKDLPEHMETHSDKKHQCEICGKFVTRKRRLNEHMRIHTQSTPFHCLYCTYKSSFRAGLKNHIQHVHINPKAPFPKNASPKGKSEG